MEGNLLDDIIGKLNGMSEGDRDAVIQQAQEATADLVWVPNPGPQTDVLTNEADEIFYGGEAGGGKTALLIGAAITQHKRSLLLRRVGSDAEKLVPMIKDVVGHKKGYNGQLRRWVFQDGVMVDIRGCEYEEDKQRFKGDPHDLIGFDEVSDFLESQYRFIIGWNRSVDPEQRCRVIAASNPPTTAEGLWVIQYWGPWLDPTHPNPALPGELRWFTTVGGVDQEVDGPGPHMLPGETKPVMARSRTFIPASLQDNPDLARTNYDSVLAGLPDELRRAYRDGDFTVGMKDGDFQVIPTDWVVAAQNRWSENGNTGLLMTAQALDCAGGGKDKALLASRYGGWYAPLVEKQGPETKEGSTMCAMVVKYRRSNCPVVVDVGGGYGGAVIEHLKENTITYARFNGSEASTAKSKDGQLRFANKRAEAHWRFREELDPDQEGGSAIALPPDPELRADLTAPTWTMTARGILIEEKKAIKKRIGRSPDKGDAVIMCLSEGNKAAARKNFGLPGGRKPVVVTNKDKKRRR